MHLFKKYNILNQYQLTAYIRICLADKKHKSTMFKTENFTARLFCKDVEKLLI